MQKSGAEITPTVWRQARQVHWLLYQQRLPRLLLRSSKPRFRTSVWSKLPESDARSVGYYLTSGGRRAAGSGRGREAGFHVIYCFYPLLINWISEWDVRTNYRALQSVTDDCGSMPTPTWSSGEVPDA